MANNELAEHAIEKIRHACGATICKMGLGWSIEFVDGSIYESSAPSLEDAIGFVEKFDPDFWSFDHCDNWHGFRTEGLVFVAGSVAGKPAFTMQVHDENELYTDIRNVLKRLTKHEVLCSCCYLSINDAAFKELLYFGKTIDIHACDRIKFDFSSLDISAGHQPRLRHFEAIGFVSSSSHSSSHLLEYLMRTNPMDLSQSKGRFAGWYLPSLCKDSERHIHRFLVCKCGSPLWFGNAPQIALEVLRGRYISIKNYQRKFRERSALGVYTESDIEEIHKKQKGLCCYCKKKFSRFDPYTIDHIVPLASGGSHFPENICLACKSCNGSKSGLSAEVFRKLKGY